LFPLDRSDARDQVVLKIIKHAEEDSSSNADVEGVLLGMVTDNQLEVTNCFALPKNDDEGNEDAEYHGKMVRHMRNANVDHLYVGWYQSNPYGSALHKFATIESQYYNQNMIAESIVLMYDPVRTQKGYLSLKAYRLTNAAMKLKKENQFTQEAMTVNHMSFTKFYEEIPVKIRNSHLVCSLMCELDEHMQPDEGKQLLDLGSVSNLEKSMQSLMKCVDKFTITQRQNIMRQYQIQRENGMRADRGETPLTEEEIGRMFKAPNTPDERLNQVLHYAQTLNYCKEVSSYSTQTIGKLFLSKALDSN
jgi:translation initiation factor 3 subunit H